MSGTSKIRYIINEDNVRVKKPTGIIEVVNDSKTVIFNNSVTMILPEGLYFYDGNFDTSPKVKLWKK